MVDGKKGMVLAACGAAIVLAAAVASAAVVVLTLPVGLPAGTEVSAADTAGVNLLEPAIVAKSSEAKANPATVDSVEREVGEWTPTGGGSGGGGSPKK